MKKKLFLLIGLCSLITYSTFAQEVEEAPEENMDTRVSTIEHTLEKLLHLKITGYVHAQFQMADSMGTPSYAAGNFAKDVDKRFGIRRSRLKFVWDKMDEERNVLGQAVFQVDFSQNGVALRDAYAQVLDPWTKWVGLRIGAFDKVFGYEVVYSSSTRETPERGKMSQILFPGEKDLGAEIFIQPTKTSRFNFFKLQAAVYNGTGVLNNDFDRKKDFIGRLTFFKNNLSETIRYSGGLSYYNGGHKSATKYKYELGTNVDDNPNWNLVDSNTTNLTSFAKQIYYGVDAQVSFDWKGGLTTLRAEYIGGTQAGTPSGSATPRTLPTGATDHTYTRQFNGAYFYWVQNILKSKHNIVVKYDFYDPNTKVNETQIGVKGTNLTAADIKFSTLGLGYYYNFDENWRVLVYGDFVKNKATYLTSYGKDIKDNVLTLRIQYRFF